MNILNAGPYYQWHQHAPTYPQYFPRVKVIIFPYCYVQLGAYVFEARPGAKTNFQARLGMIGEAARSSLGLEEALFVW